ncbi:cytochrome P450 3A2-like [Centruroides vittatus]|uniref:cytochrome P450 3A2-like n=1 Tax=Centruroides vittatus TaxID=120091 RepID=UPI00350F4124
MELLEICNYKWFIFFVLALLLSVLYVKKRVSYWKNHGIPSVTTGIWSLFVALRTFINTPHHLHQLEEYKKYGRIHGIYLGLEPQLVIAEPHILKKILVKDFNMFHNRMDFEIGNPLFDKMLSVLTDDDWKRIRCIISPTFSSSRMRKMANLVRECAEKFSTDMRKLIETNGDQPIDCKKYLSNFSLDVIASTAFGTKFSSLDDPNNTFVNKFRKATSTNLSFRFVIFFFFPKIFKYLKINVFGDSMDYFKEFTLHVIEKREKENEKRNDFLQLLFDAQKGTLEISPEDAKETNEKNEVELKILPKHKTMSVEEMIAQCMLFLFAGSETSTNTLSLVLHYLSLYPEFQEKLIQEIDNVWSANKEINFDVLTSMPYLDAVISETLRIQPIGFQLFRECTEEYEISEIGFKIPKKMVLVVPVYAMHHDEEFYPNPEKFDPERFMPENKSSIPPYAYLPFGEGPRNCIGMRFALMVLKMCLVHILHDFRVLATEESKPLEFYAGQGLIQPKKVMVKFESRKR